MHSYFMEIFSYTKRRCGQNIQYIPRRPVFCSYQQKYLAHDSRRNEHNNINNNNSTAKQTDQAERASFIMDGPKTMFYKSKHISPSDSQSDWRSVVYACSVCEVLMSFAKTLKVVFNIYCPPILGLTQAQTMFFSCAYLILRIKMWAYFFVNGKVLLAKWVDILGIVQWSLLKIFYRKN